MMVIIIGKNRVEYCNVRKKDVSKRFYVSRDQQYSIVPECFRQMEIKHNGAWVRTETVIVFDENNALPYFCEHPEYYEQDARLTAIDKEKYMRPRKSRSQIFFTQGGKNSPWRQFLAGLPLIVVMFIVVWGVIFG